MAALLDEAATVDEVLDRLPVTDRVFHDLKHTQPLVDALIEKVQSFASHGRVLIIGPNALLPVALKRLGYSVDLWHLPEGHLVDELTTHVTRTGSLKELLAPAPVGAGYDVIVLPYVLESSGDPPSAVLETLRHALSPEGRIIVAFGHAGALEHRLRALSGHAPLADPAVGAQAVSYSWPLTRPVRVFTLAEFSGWCRQADLRVVDQSYAIDRRPAVAIHAMTVASWFGAELGHAAMALVPGLRSSCIAVLAAHSIDRPAPDSPDGEIPIVSIVISGRDPRRLQATLESCKKQTHPIEKLEVIVLQGPETRLASEAPAFARLITCVNPTGVEAADLALRMARGQIVAFTDEFCTLPRNWVELGAAALDRWTVAATGPVLAGEDSAVPFLVMPGARPLDRDEGWFSTSNAFLRRDVALAAGGILGLAGDARAPQAWASLLAYRLVDLGYLARFAPTVQVARFFPFVHSGQSRSNWMRDEFRRAEELPKVVRQSPALGRKLLKHGIFASRQTMHFNLMLVGLVGAALRRRPGLVALALPFALSNRRFLPFWPPWLLKPAARNLRGIVMRHGLWLAGMALGSVKARRIVL